jgi:hypothetical protein
MGHATILNGTAFEFEPLFLADENGRALLVPVIKATYALPSIGSPRIADKQLPVNLEGELWGEAGNSSYKYEPQCAFTKLATDVVLVGSAYAGFRGATEVYVRLRVGPLDKTVRVTGDRFWLKVLGTVSMTSPRPFERVPLIYERAFGGWDRSHPDPIRHAIELRNPVGTGFRSKDGKFEEGIRLPNLEDPRDPVREYGATPAPAGFGFTSPDWQPRAGFAGTYDEHWTNERMPLLPKDFDRRFFNAASPGLIAPGYLKGDEAVWIENASPRGMISFNLPGVPPPECRIQLARGPDVHLQTNLDTIIINTDENLVLLLWRAWLPLRTGPHDLIGIQVVNGS